MCMRPPSAPLFPYTTLFRSDVEPHGGKEHSRSDLVAVRNADQRVGAVGVDHVLDAVGDQLAAQQRIEHSAVAHGEMLYSLPSRDRKSTRLNSSHLGISYAVF